MPILAFLQNQWFRDPERVKRMIARNPAVRPNMIRCMLFAGCKTGRVLKTVFGEELCDEIIWDEASTVIAGDPNTIYPAEPAHMQAVIDEHQPERILVFGKIAWKGMQGCKTSAGVLYGPHPAARQPDTISKLKMMHTDLVNAMNLKL